MSSSGDGERSPWAQRGFIAAAVVVALIAVLAVVLVLTGPSDDPGTVGAQPPATTTPATPTATPGGTSTSAGSASTISTPDDGSVCGLPEGEQTVPVSAPPDTTWELVGTMAAPTAPDTHGPGEVRDGLRSCFARSPLGVLYAAVNVLASTTDPDLREPLVRDLAAAGEGRDAALRLLAEPQPPADTGTQIQVAGFAFLDYDQNAATVDLAVRAAPMNGSGGYVHLAVPMRWEDGNWKLVVPPAGDLVTNVRALPDLTGYAPWSGA